MIPTEIKSYPGNQSKNKTLISASNIIVQYDCGIRSLSIYLFSLHISRTNLACQTRSISHISNENASSHTARISHEATAHVILPH